MKKTILHRAIVVGLASLFTGCAVLTVDVDVYKGPLANHEDIQMEQMAAMATGAKPLLIELRDRLEANYMKTIEVVVEHDPNSPNRDSQLERQLKLYRRFAVGTTNTTRLLVLREEPWYESDFVKPYRDEWGVLRSRFLDSNADHVNNILSLYEDREHCELRGTIFKMLARYRESYAILRPKDMAKDKDLVKEVQKAEKTVNEKAAKETKEKASKGPTALDILNAYKDYLNFDRRDALKVVQVTLAYLKTAESNSPLLIKLKSIEDSNENPLNNVTNAAQRLLAETELVDVFADEVFGLQGELRDQFVGRVKQIARAYLDSRAALEDLWLATMDGIICVNCQPVDPNESAERNEFTARMVDFSLEIIQPRYLAVLLDAAQKKAISKDIDDLAASLGRYPSADPNISNNQWDFEQMKDVLAVSIKKDPVKTAELLKTIHEFCKSVLDPEKTSINQYVDKGDLGGLAYREGWKFGLVRAPFAELGELMPENLMVGAAKIEPQGGAFACGRLDKGLETLIEEYLKQGSVYDPNDNELRCARQRLSDALVGFAEKLLFVANNRSLMSPPKGDSGLLLGTVLGVYRLLLGETFIDWMRDFGAIPYLPEDTEQYTRILQAVGNSILVQADALHQERKHREQLKDHYEKEEAILRATLDRMSPADQNSVDVSAIKGTLSKYSTAKYIRDVWITLLEYEHDLALRNGDKARAGQVLEAINAARKKREDMIFIRPAMAYLRTSFPATSLQGNPNLTWDNMLAGHAMRSVPFAPQIGEFLDPDAKRDARINAEIDKQFWQNINRVRVAGGGDTNYAVVKDDIGNWYVKSYSANPKDIIESAKGLAMFAAGGKMDANLLTPPNQTDGAGKAPETTSSALESVFDKYRDEYRKKTEEEYSLLYSILKDLNADKRVESRIQASWDARAEIMSCDQIKGPLKASLDGSYTNFLEPFTSNLKDELKDTDAQRQQIVEGIRRLRQFQNDLNGKIEEMAPKADSNSSQTEQNKLAKDAARSIVEDVVEGRIDTLLADRRDAIKTYEGALIFLAEATQQKE